MSQPVKLSKQLVLDARLAAELEGRSIAEQIEFWARLGRAIEPLLSRGKCLSLTTGEDQIALSELIKGIDSMEGRRRVSVFLATQPYPHYEVAEGQPGLVVRIEEDGARTIGRSVNKKFEPVSTDIGL